MIHGQKIVVVMPAYNAEKTLRRTYDDIPHEYVDGVILVDDASSDRTAALAEELNILTIVHRENRGYGANQKTCYRAALEQGAEVVVMVHPDYQYSPRLIVAMASMIAMGEFDVVLGSRILTGEALSGGMPFYKYAANRVLTLFQNLLLNKKLSEYHTGFRAFSRQVLESLPLEQNGDDFVFDNQMLAQTIWFGYRIGEVSCHTRYFEDASSISLGRSIRYGLGVVATSLRFRACRWGLTRDRLFSGGKAGAVTEDTP